MQESKIFHFLLKKLEKKSANIWRLCTQNEMFEAMLPSSFFKATEIEFFLQLKLFSSTMSEWKWKDDPNTES